MISKISSFLQESKQELRRVNWPTLAQTRHLTLIVVILSVLTALFLGVLDVVFLFVLERALGF